MENFFDSPYLQEQQFLGRGGFSQVYKVIINEKPYALKKIHPSILKDPVNRQNIMREVSIMKRISHPNIIKFYQCLQNSNREFNLLLQYVEGGTLYEKLKTQEKLSESQARTYIKDIISAISYLHNEGILHRDIKPENILLTSKNGSPSCKLADFGSSNLLSGNKRTSYVGTEEYMAPQILNGQEYGESVDLWCLGILVYEMLVGTVPKGKEGAENTIISVPQWLSRPAQDLIKRLLHKDPSLRMTLQQLQNHIWLTDESPMVCDVDSGSQIIQQISQKSQDLKLTESKNSLERIAQIRRKEQSWVQKNKSSGGNHRSHQQKRIPEMFEKVCDVESESQKYLKLIRHRVQLKKAISTQQSTISQLISFYEKQKPFVHEEMLRYKEKIRQYSANSKLLRDSNLKPDYCTLETVSDLLGKLESLQLYVDGLPYKIEEEILEFPKLRCSQHTLPISEYIFKLKTYMMQCKRDALIDLLALKKRNQSFIIQS